MKKVSIIIPAYNIELYIKECLESIINQTYKNLQIIVINDGSTDKTLDICSNIRDSRIEIINKKNGGVSSARNAGLKKVSGEYFLFVDGDDVLDTNAVEILVKMIETSKADIAICGHEKFISQYTNDVYMSSNNNIYTSKEYFKAILAFQQNTYAWGTLIKKKYKNIVKFPENDYFEDLGTMYKLYEQVKSIVYNPVSLVKYRQNPHSIVHTYKEKKIIDYVKYGDEICRNIEDTYPDLKAKCNTYRCYIYIAAYSMAVDKNKKLAKEYRKKIKQYHKEIDVTDISRLIKIKLLIFKYSISLGCLLLKLKGCVGI